MASAYERRKEPAVVRRALLDCAASIAGKEGLVSVTVAGVSAAAGVTKGALFHHFENKQALVDAMFDELMAQLDAAVDAQIAADPVQRGCFTRAYVSTALTMDETTTGMWSALISSLMGESQLAAKWHDWLAERLHRHAATDTGSILDIVRMAADGAWLNCLTPQTASSTIDFQKIRMQLMAMTYEQEETGGTGSAVA